jgi:hypothetical protein
MADPLPIVFMHYGGSNNYLPFTVGQAKIWSLNSPLILIGDRHNNQFPFVTHVDMNRYAKQALAFQKIYKHFSPNNAPYELFCFIRWFLLRDLMAAHGIERLMHLDSDVLLYVDVNFEQQNWRQYDLTLVNGVCAGNMFVNGRRGINELCDVIWEMYARPDAAERLAEAYRVRQQTREGVSDMVPLRAYYDANRDRVAEMTGVRADGSYWDANIHLPEGFEMDGPRKRFRFVDGVPYCRDAQSGRDVRFKCLHFQGIAKPHIEAAFRAGLASRPVAQAA